MGVVDESVRTAYADCWSDAIFEVDGSAKTCFLEVTVGGGLMDGGCCQFPAFSQSMFETK